MKFFRKLREISLKMCQIFKKLSEIFLKIGKNFLENCVKIKKKSSDFDVGRIASF